MSQWLSLFLLKSLYATYTGHMLKFIEIYRVFLRQIDSLNNFEQDQQFWFQHWT